MDVHYPEHEYVFCPSSPRTETDEFAADNGHDSNVQVAGAWARSFIEPLLKNSNFMNRTLLLLSMLPLLKRKQFAVK